MADFGSPATANYTAPDGLATLGNLMGLKQRQQQMQATAAAIPGIQANSQMEQQTAQQRGAAAQFFKNFDLSKHVKDDGTLDLDSAMTSPELRATGDAAPEIIKGLIGIKNQQLDAKQALVNLNATTRDQFRQNIGGLVSDPDVQSGNQTGRGKVMDEITRFAQGGETEARIAQIYAQPLMHADPKKLPGLLKDINLQAIAAGQQAEATKAGGPMVTGPGGALKVVNTNPNAPQPVGSQVGQSAEQGLSPTQTPAYVRATSAAGQEGAKGASNDEDLYNSITANASKAGQIKSLTQDISRLADEVKTGSFSKALANKWTNIAQTLGVSPGPESQTTRRQLLGKYVEQLAIQQEQANGASTDAAQAHVHAALPNADTMDPEAIKAAAKYVGGQADLAQARANVANKQRQANGGTSTGLRAVDNAFTSNADPRVYVYKGLTPGPERQAFLREHFKSREEIQDFLDKQSVLDHLSR